MKTKTFLLLLSTIVLCQCIKSPYGSQPPTSNVSDITQKLDTMVSQLIHEKYEIFGEVGTLEADTLTAQCYEAALSEIAKKYGDVSEEYVACLQHVADYLRDPERPFSETSILGYNCYQKALTLSKKLYGENSIPVGICYSDMVFASGRDNYWAQQYADSALAILIPECGEQSVEVGNTYLYLGDSYRQCNHDIYRVAVQIMMAKKSEYMEESDYENIIPNLEKALSNYHKALDIFTGIGEDCNDKIQIAKESIENTEDELKNNKDGLAYVKAHPQK